MSFFGLIDSSSSSDNRQSTVTDTQDNHIVAGSDSTNLTLSRATISGGLNLETTDHGAVNQSFQLARDITAQAQAENDHALGAVADANRTALATVADAYTTAKAGEQKVLVAGVFALIAIVAIKVMK